MKFFALFLLSFVLAFVPNVAFADGSLDHVLNLAFENHPSLKESDLGIRQAEANLQSQQALYPWTLNADTGFRFDEQPTEDAIQSGIRKTTIYNGSVELLKQFTFGTRLSMRLDLNRNLSEVPINLPQFNVSQIQTIGPNYGSAATVTLNQPILRGFGTSLYAIPVDAARQQKSIAELTKARAEMDVVAGVINAYWAWVRAAWDFEAANDQKGRAEYYKDITEAQIQAGTVAALQRDIVLQRTLAAEQAIIVSKSSLEDANTELKKAVGVSDATQLGLQPPTAVPLFERPVSLDASLKSAFETSPDIALLASEEQAADLNVKQSEDAVKPRLDGVATIAQLGLSENLGESFEQVATFQFTTLFLGISFSMPLGNKNASGKLEADRINVQRAEIRRQIAEREIETQIKKAYRLVALQAERRALSEKEIVLAKKNLDAMREKYEAGRASYSEMRDQETELQDAELRDRQSKADYVLALVALRRLDGTLLTAFSIQNSK